MTRARVASDVLTVACLDRIKRGVGMSHFLGRGPAMRLFRNAYSSVHRLISMTFTLACIKSAFYRNNAFRYESGHPRITNVQQKYMSRRLRNFMQLVSTPYYTDAIRIHARIHITYVWILLHARILPAASFQRSMTSAITNMALILSALSRVPYIRLRLIK